jgi:hypothetical protein
VHIDADCFILSGNFEAALQRRVFIRQRVDRNLEQVYLKLILNHSGLGPHNINLVIVGLLLSSLVEETGHFFVLSLFLELLLLITRHRLKVRCTLPLSLLPMLFIQ